MQPIRVLIADDHPLFRFGLHTLLDGQTDIEVIGEATTGRDAVVLAQTLLPTVVLMDINMPELNGIAATEQICATQPQIAVLIVTMLEDDTVFAAMRAGARGYLLKGAEPAETLRAIRAVAAGDAIFGTGIAERLIAHFAQPPRGTGRGATPVSPFPELTEREREVLFLMAQGLTNSAIADRLVLSNKTVRNYITEIFSKLHVADRAAAVALARQEGLGIDGG